MANNNNGGVSSFPIGTRLNDIDLACRKAEEAGLRRYEAAGWLQQMVGVVGAKDLAAEPSEHDFRLGLRSGLILCNLLNKVRPGAVPNIVDTPSVVPDGAALSAFQYFENVRNFLVAVQEMRLPTFEASDLEQGGNSARIVNCVLALKSYYDTKLAGGYSENLKPSNSGKLFMRKNSQPFMNSFSRNSSTNNKSPPAQLNANADSAHNTEINSNSLNTLVRTLLSDKKPEQVPILVESMLSNVIEEFERRLASHNESMKTAIEDMVASEAGNSPPRTASSELKTNIELRSAKEMKKTEHCPESSSYDKKSNSQLLKQKALFDRQTKDIQELKHTLHSTKTGMQFMETKYHEEFNNLGKYVNNLAQAASGYHRVLEENRKLYNQVQDLKGSIRVYCRVRPFMPGQPNGSSSVDHIEEGTISVLTPSRHGKGCKSFKFNKVFGQSASQEEVFSDTQPLIRSVLDGFNVCIFAYGQTGSGKTYTMSGPRELTEKSKGVNYRALNDLFLLSQQRKGLFCYDISVQMIEIYNEQVRDLLVTHGLNKRLEIRNSSQNGVNVPDANLVPVSSTSDVIKLMNIGQMNRAVGSTALNDRSSRSHSCLTVHVQGRDLTTGNILRGCMHLVDLAGSERVDKSEVTGERLKEAQHINRSLSALGDVIASLSQNNAHVPYRNSKLTQLLQDSLGGQAKTLMFVHISPELDAVGETLSTLKFAERVATVELGAAKQNRDSGDVKELKEQITSLKAALARKEEASEHVQLSISRTPERRRTKAGGSSPSLSHRQVGTNIPSGLSNPRQPMEDVGNIEVRNNSPLGQKRPNFDLQELLNSPPWPPVNNLGLNFQKEDEKETGSGDWVDKVMVNKLDSVTKDINQLGHINGENTLLYQRHVLESRVYPHPDLASTDGSDQLEVAMSDSSESDLPWQFNLPKSMSLLNGIVPKTKKPHANPVNSPDISSVNRSVIPRHGQSPSKKLTNGVGKALHQNGRNPAPGDVKQKTGRAK